MNDAPPTAEDPLSNLHLVLRARFDADFTGPRQQFWGGRGWTSFSNAERQPSTTSVTDRERIEVDAIAALGNFGATLHWVPDLPRDLDGYPYITAPLGPWRVTHCCAAMAGIDDGPYYCKSCHETLDMSYDTPARLDADWGPGDGPIRVTLH